MSEDAQRLAEMFDAAANALHSMADKLRLEPNGVLAKAVRPTTIKMDPGLTAEFKIGHAEAAVSWVSIVGSGRVREAELGFQAVWNNGVVTLVPDIVPAE